jgi:hypothetical protein
MSKRPYLENTSTQPRELHEALTELRYLRHHEIPSAFRRDLAVANQDLQRQGVLPNMEIVATRHGLKVRREPGRYGNEPAANNGMYAPDSSAPMLDTAGRRGFSGRNNNGMYAPDSGTPMLDPAGRRGLSGRGNGYPRGDLDQQRYGNIQPTEPSYAGSNRGLAGLDFNATSYSGARGSSYERAYKNAQIVAEVARQKGVPEDLAVATMLVESRGNERAKGDHGHSIGGFQLNDHGEGKGYSYAQKIDIAFNANVALSEFQRRQGWYKDEGEWAAGSQRPKHPHRYAERVTAMLPYARALLGS